MKLLQVFWLFLAFGLFVGCSGDDDSSGSGQEQQLPSFRLLGGDESEFYQYNYSAPQQTGESINLTQQDNLNQILTLRQVEDLLFFFSFSGGNFSLLERNAVTGGIQNYPDYYTVNAEQSVIWGANSEDRVFMAYFAPAESGNLGIRTRLVSTGEEEDVPLATSVDDVPDPFYFRQRLFITYEDILGDYKILVFDTENSVVLDTLEFGNTPPSILIDQGGDLAVVRGGNGANYTLEIYDFEDLDLLSSRDFTLDLFFPTGPQDAFLAGDRLYYQNFYAQPALATFGPAIYDFSTSTNSIIDMIGIVREVQQELDQEIQLSAFGFDPATRTFIIGYNRTNSGIGVGGGAMVIGEDGTLLENITLPYTPFYIIKS